MIDRSPATPAQRVLQKPEALEYAPRAPVRHGRRFRRVVLVLALLAAACIAVGLSRTTSGRDFWASAALRYHIRNCDRYTAPVDQMVLDSDPARVAKLANDPNYLVNTDGYAVRTPPDDFRSIDGEEFLGFSGDIWRLSPNPNAAILFLHSRRSPDGMSRLVIVMVAENPTGNISPSLSDISVICYAGSPTPSPSNKSALARSGFAPSTFGFGWTDGRTPIRFFAGQPDPVDESHFVLRFEWQGRPGTADLYLENDGRIHSRPKRP